MPPRAKLQNRIDVATYLGPRLQVVASGVNTQSYNYTWPMCTHTRASDKAFFHLPKAHAIYHRPGVDHGKHFPRALFGSSGNKWSVELCAMGG